MSVEILPADQLHFLLYAEKFRGKYGVPKPLRRSFSLMRACGCKTVVCEETVICEETNWQNLCSQEQCGLRFASCSNYLKKLPNFKYKLDKKICWKIGFFNSEFKDEEELASQLSENCMGYCIVQRDEITDDKNTAYPISYVTESLLQDPYAGRGITFGTYSSTFPINGKKFEVNEKYFSQQNGITNCCAHAAIKMAIRSYCPDITSERINEILGIDHIHRKGSKGLTTDEICQAIEKLSGLKTHVLRPNKGISPMDFLSAIYFAIESRFPVILGFFMPGRNGAPPNGHAITIVGHTFNEHNWWPYGLKGYFTQREEDVQYLQSLLWCDNFVVQDDNFGQYYSMPVRFLTDSTGLCQILTSIEGAMISTMPISIGEEWLRMPPCAILIYPEEKPLAADSFLIEPWALSTLNRYIALLSDDNELPDTELFNKYFSVYQKARNLILRTFTVTKKEYLNSDGIKVVPDQLREILSEQLPDTFWITEISLPELFWINKAKIGEIITDPESFKKSHEKAVKFIRLPNIVSFHDEDSLTYFHIPQNEQPAHQPLILASGF